MNGSSLCTGVRHVELYSGMKLDSHGLDVNMGFFQVWPVWVEWMAESLFNSVTSCRGFALYAILSLLKWIKVSDTRLPPPSPLSGTKVKPAAAPQSLINNLVNPTFCLRIHLVAFKFSSKYCKINRPLFLCHFIRVRKGPTAGSLRFQAWNRGDQIFPRCPSGPRHNQSGVGRSFSHRLAVAKPLAQSVLICSSKLKRCNISE